MTRPARAVIAWSSGKDSALALHRLRQSGELEVVAALTTVTAEFARVSMHGVREELLDRQLQLLGLPGYKVQIPWPCPNEVYDQAMARALEHIERDGITHIVYGDLYLEDVRAYREQKLAGSGITPVFPLWRLDSREVAEAILDSGIRALVSCVDVSKLDRSFAGRTFDRQLLRDLPRHVDPCGERGEFHTVVVDGPIFAAPIDTRIGAIVERDGFVYADVIPMPA